VKPNINSDEVHPQLRNNRQPVDGAPVWCWFTEADEWLNTRVTKRTTPECRNLLVVSAVYVEELYTT
jgi:hypothetical protein